MSSVVELSPRQRGDFQTPKELAREVWSTVDASQFDLVIEPTFGLGSFLVTVPEGCTADILGWEIKEAYYRDTVAKLHKRATRLFNADVFNVSAVDIPPASRVLVIGNPPWVTNSEQSTLGGQNTGIKKNFKSLNGLQAMTGKANFDISEAIILHFVTLLKNRPLIQFAMLGKFTVLRNLIQFFASLSHIGEFEFHRIDSAKYFGAAVDAGLIKFKVGQDVIPGLRCPIYQGINGTRISDIGLIDDRLVYDLEAYKKTCFMEHRGPRTHVWRQGIKHDLRDVFELRESAKGLINRLGEVVDVEPETLYRLYKSSDVFHGRSSRYVIPVYQRDLKDTLEDLPQRYPRLYRYLAAHREAFEARQSRIYKNRNAFTVFGIGEYTHCRYKIAIGALYTEPAFRLLEPDTHPVIVDDTAYMLATDDYDEALYLLAILSLPCTKNFVLAISNWTDKRRYSKDVLDRVLIPPIAACPREIIRAPDKLEEWLSTYEPTPPAQLSLF